MDAKINYFCLEYNGVPYIKLYFSLNPDGTLNYETPTFYTLEEMDNLLKTYSKEQILSQMREDNVLYFLGNETDFKNIKLFLCHQENGKERKVTTLSQECLLFQIEDFFQNEFDDINRKLIYNNLGGYLDNPKTSKKMKDWIKMLKAESQQRIMEDYQNLSYVDKRKIREVVFGVLTLNEDKKIEKPFMRKKIQGEIGKVA